MSIAIVFVVLVGLCESLTLDVSSDVDLADLQPDVILSTVLKLSYSLQMEAKALVSEAEKIRSEAQEMRSEAQATRSEAADSRREAEDIKRDVEMIRDETQKMQEDARSMMEEGKNSMNQAFEVLFRSFTFFTDEGSGDSCSEIEDTVNSLKEDTTASSTLLSSISTRLESMEINMTRAVAEIGNKNELQDIKSRLATLGSAMTSLDEKVVETNKDALQKLAEIQTASNNLTTMSTHLGSALQTIDEKVEDSNQNTESLAVKFEEKFSILGTQMNVS